MTFGWRLSTLDQNLGLDPANATTLTGILRLDFEVLIKGGLGIGSAQLSLVFVGSNNSTH